MRIEKTNKAKNFKVDKMKVEKSKVDRNSWKGYIKKRGKSKWRASSSVLTMWKIKGNAMR